MKKTNRSSTTRPTVALRRVRGLAASELSATTGGSSNMLKNDHDTMKAIIQNMRV